MPIIEAITVLNAVHTSEYGDHGADQQSSPLTEEWLSLWINDSARRLRTKTDVAAEPSVDEELAVC